MNTYLLLRDNKESGPYSFDDLISHGLKAYDLVWVRGKSAAWRYPSEVEELKEFAPVVEEQPFDRFFKKKTETEKQEINFVKKENITPSNPVFESAPVQKTKTIIPERADSSPISKTIMTKQSPVEAEIKYSKPLDEIKEMYVNTLLQRKKKIARKNFLTQNLKRATVFFCLIAFGVLVGFMIKSKSAGKQEISSRQTENAQPAITGLAPVNQQYQEGLTEIKSKDKKTTTSQNLQPQKSTLYKSKSVPKKNESVLPKKNETVSTQSSPALINNPLTGERNKKSRIEGEEDKMIVKDDISKLVSVKSNDYKRGAFGGIRDLQLTVTNDSKYILNNVTVELQYLKPSEQPLKSENIQFKSISPNGSLTITIPPSNRGIKVLYKITKIESKELNDETAGM